MQVIIRSVHKYWSGSNSASTQLIAVPRSRVIAQASLSAVETAPGGRAWARVTDARSAAFWSGPATFGSETTLTATTDLLALQVFTEGEGTAAAVATIHLSPALDVFAPGAGLNAHISGTGTIGPVKDGAAEMPHPVEQSEWAAYGEGGDVVAVHSFSRYEGADSIDRAAIASHLVALSATDGAKTLGVVQFETADMLRAGQLRVDAATGRFSVVPPKRR